MYARLKILLCLYFLILVIFAAFIFPYGDTFYYWEWSNHLGLSYLDGPPMIAYMMRFTTTLFGNTFFALNVIGVLCALGVCFFIYRIAKLWYDERFATFAAFLWVLFPLLAQSNFIRVTYDAPELLFWSSTLYFTVLYVLSRQSKFLYLMGISMGLGLLSKYTGVILMLGICIYLLSVKDLRNVFKRIHLYLALGICFLIFSPVLIWNYQHHWVSFAFQFGQHTIDHSISLAEHLHNMVGFLWRMFYCLSFLLIFPFLRLKQQRSPKQALIARLCWTVSAVFVLIWFVGSYSAFAKINYFLPATIALALLSAEKLYQNYQVLTRVILSVFALLSLVFLIDATIWVAPHISYEYPIYLLQKNLMLEAQKNGVTPTITTGWNSVPRLEFIAKEYHLPNVVIPKQPCDISLEGQYQFWGKSIENGEYHRVLYLNVQFPYPACIQPYFKTCQPLQTIPYNKSQIFTHHPLAVNIYSMTCSN